VFLAGDLVQLTDAKGRMHTITLEPGRVFHTHRGQLAHDSLIGSAEGTVHNIGLDYVALRPNLDDFVLSMPRGAAVIYPKDAARIVGLTSLGPGSRVLEAGAGSGALTCFLLRAVGEHGQVISYERRAEFADVATGNVQTWFGSVPDHWLLRRTELVLDGDLRDLDAVILDMVNPWDYLSLADAALRPGGSFLGYVTTTTQLSNLVESMRAQGRWSEPRAEETLMRTWHLNGLAVRPDHRMIGHTAFLVTARHLAPGVTAVRRRERPAPGAHSEVVPGADPG